MNSSLPESNQLINEDVGVKILDSHCYWAKKRLLFNILVGVVGVLAIFSFGFLLSVFDVFGIIIWGLVANGLYSFGYVLESQIIVKTNGGKSLKMYRNMLFWVGTLAYVLVTVAFAYEYFATLAEK